MAQIIDACGRSFRELVLMTKKALESKQDRYKILVDNNTARQNVTRFANSAGYEVQVTEEADLFRSKDHLSGLDHGWFGQGLC